MYCGTLTINDMQNIILINNSMVSSTTPEIVVEIKIRNYLPRYSKQQFKTF